MKFLKAAIYCCVICILSLSFRQSLLDNSDVSLFSRFTRLGDEETSSKRGKSPIGRKTHSIPANDVSTYVVGKKKYRFLSFQWWPRKETKEEDRLKHLIEENNEQVRIVKKQIVETKSKRKAHRKVPITIEPHLKKEAMEAIEGTERQVLFLQETPLHTLPGVAPFERSLPNSRNEERSTRLSSLLARLNLTRSRQASRRPYTPVRSVKAKRDNGASDSSSSSLLLSDNVNGRNIQDSDSDASLSSLSSLFRMELMGRSSSGTKFSADQNSTVKSTLVKSNSTSSNYAKNNRFSLRFAPKKRLTVHRSISGRCKTNDGYDQMTANMIIHRQYKFEEAIFLRLKGRNFRRYHTHLDHYTKMTGKRKMSYQSRTAPDAYVRHPFFSKNYEELFTRRQRLFDLVPPNPATGVCDGCKLPVPLTSVTTESKFKPCTLPRTEYTLRKYVGNTEVNACKLESPARTGQDSEVGVTAIAVSTVSRLYFFKQLLYRWKGWYSVSVIVPEKLLPRILSYISNRSLPSRITLLIVMCKEQNEEECPVFPVNLLRNLSIKHSTTSHYLILDMDMWPSTNLYSEILSVPPSILNSSTSAIIVPAIFYHPNAILRFCFKLHDCVLMGLELFPETHDELIGCLMSRVCQLTKNGIRTHLYTTPDWLLMPSNVHIAKLHCLIVDKMEPYVILRKGPTTPLFDERFTGYGYNKVQLIEHLRMIGYNFYIMTRAYALDMPHPLSTFRANYTARKADSRSPTSVDNIFCQFLNETIKKNPTARSFPICSRLNRTYYLEPVDDDDDDGGVPTAI